MSFGRNLSIIMGREGVTSSSRLSALSGISPPGIRNIINGRCIPNIYTVAILLESLGYDLYLVASDGAEEKYNLSSGWINFILKHEDITAIELAECTGYHKTSIYNYLRDMRSINLHVLEEIAKILGYSIKIRKADVEYDLFKPIDIWRTAI